MPGHPSGRTDLNFNLKTYSERLISNDAAITEILALAKQHLSSLSAKPYKSHEEWMAFTLINMLVRTCDLQAANTLYIRHQLENLIEALDDATITKPPQKRRSAD